MRRSLLGLLLILVATGTLVIVRTLRHRPAPSEPVSRVSIELDEQLVAKHLSEAVQFRTVSHQNRENFEAQVFEDFIEWVAETYPHVNDSMSLTRVGDYTLLYRWSGKDGSLKPILITAHYDVVPVIPDPVPS